MPVEGGPAAAEPPHRRPGPAPVPMGMTEAEKRAAEWEARHDVAARGRRVSPDALQHYFAHERLAERHPTGRSATPPADGAATGAGAGASADAPAPSVTPAGEAVGSAPPGGPGRIARLLRRLARGER